MTKIDQRRLNDGVSALKLKEPQTKQEIESQLQQLRDAIAAMQSLDDLGSEESNSAAMIDHDALLAKYIRLERKLNEISC